LCFQVVLDVRQLAAEVQSEFLVGEIHASGTDVILNTLPKDAAGHAFDQIRVVDNDTVIFMIVFDYGRADQMCGLKVGGGRLVLGSLGAAKMAIGAAR